MGGVGDIEMVVVMFFFYIIIDYEVILVLM